MGKTAQFSQIYDKFGFDFIIAAKHASKERAPHCEFLWEAPDGTKVLTTRLGEHAWANFFMNV
jgi:mannosylglycerate hydrolase